MILNENVKRKIIPIAGGKGGVGKSVIAVNLALAMAFNKKKTLLVDLDLGGSNIHTLLGEKNNKPGIGNFISGYKTNLQNLICPTKWENLSYIPGDVLVYGIGEIPKTIKSSIIENLLAIDVDYMIIDLGSGTNFTVLDFFLISNSGFVVITPQMTSVMNAYSFIKNYVFRFFQRAFFRNKKVSDYINSSLKERLPSKSITMSKIIEGIRKIDRTAADSAGEFLLNLHPKLILNKFNTKDDIAIAESLSELCRNTLHVELELMGSIKESEHVRQSVESLIPFILAYPEQIITLEIGRICQKIIQSKNFPKMPLAFDYYKNTFELANIETENDLDLIQKNQASSGELDADKLIELVQMQQGKIEKLQSTIKMLTINQQGQDLP